jgi:hypothetical protein
MSRLSFKVRLRLLPTEWGGRSGPIFREYGSSWDLKNTWHGIPTITDGRLLLDGISELAPGAEGPAILQPLAPEFWGAVEVGAVLPMQELGCLVGYATVTAVASRPEHFTREVAAFVVQAQQFCEFIVKASTFSLAERLAIARQRLLELYEAGCALPHVEPPTAFDAGPNPAAPPGWVGFEKFEVYWEVFDPGVDAAPVAGALSDDLLDIYRDVHRGLKLWESCAPIAAAIWEWRFHFDAHWGEHAMNALRALHRACREA